MQSDPSELRQILRFCIYLFVYRFGTSPYIPYTNYLTHSAFCCGRESILMYWVLLACTSYKLTAPCPQGFVDTAIRIFSRLLRGKLLTHTFHPRTKRIPPSPTFWLRALQTGFAGVGMVIGSPAFGVQASGRIFAFLPLPSGSFSHKTPSTSRQLLCR